MKVKLTAQEKEKALAELKYLQATKKILERIKKPNYRSK